MQGFNAFVQPQMNAGFALKSAFGAKKYLQNNDKYAMLVYGEVGCRKALGRFQRTNGTAVQFESGKGDVRNSAAAFVF